MSETNPKLLDLIPKNKEWVVNEETRNGSSSDENKKLELRLGPPGDDLWSSQNIPNHKQTRERDESLFSLNCFSNRQQQQQQRFPTNHNPYTTSPFLHPYQTGPNGLPVMAKESSQCAEKKPPFAPVSANTAVPNNSQKRAAPAPVVGWPPIRSCRKNLASTSTSSAKAVSEVQNAIPSKALNEKPAVENTHKGLFVKINMDGVPIGRKVDLNANNSYDKLSSAVDELFRGLLAAQTDFSDEMVKNKEEQKAITGLLDGSGEYTLVYEDNEGDRMLVGDVPWPMFVSTVKRLRVLKSSDLSTLSRVGSKAGKMGVENASK